MVEEMKYRASQHELAEIFFIKYPYARTDVLYLTEVELYGGEDGEYVVGHINISSVWYSGPLLSKMEYTEREDRETPKRHGISRFLFFLFIQTERLTNRRLNCAANYRTLRDWTNNNLIEGKEEIRKALQSSFPCKD